MSTKSVIIIGGGLVGSLCGILMARRGYNVTLYEYRADIRQSPDAPGRSINLALSQRGRKALKLADLEEVILQAAIPMKGRLIHSLKGQKTSILYDESTNQCIFSVGRNYLNRVLLNELERFENVTLCFNHKLIGVNFKAETVSILNVKTNGTLVVSGDLIIGADGAFSTLRRFMQQTPLFDYSQKYIEHGYVELTIPAINHSKMVPNHLHIWPRGEFMMIALPNQDCSWTVTLFMPFEKFQIGTADELLLFFENVFPDAVELIGAEALAEEFFKKPPAYLHTVKCRPYHRGAKFLLIGDAAHAMVPFYGQGMNAGFEDCSILHEVLDQYGDEFQSALQEFTYRRLEDADAICDLALYNYVEMRDLVTKPSFQARRLLDRVLFKIFPGTWVPLYNSVTFTHRGYKQCLESKIWQDKVVILFQVFLIFIFVLLFLHCIWY